MIQTKEADDTNLTAVLQKDITDHIQSVLKNLKKIKEAIKHVYKNVSSIDFTNNTIKFEVNNTPTNFHFTIRKVINPQNTNQYRYVMWYVPFDSRENIDTPGTVFKREASPFDKNVNIPNFLSNIYNFFIKALLMNK
jgi:hypothetical protein